MQVKIKPDEEIFIPMFGSKEASGADIRANLNVEPVNIFGESNYLLGSAVEIMPNSRVLIDCGFNMELDKGYEAQIRPRSGLSTKQGIHIPNSPGTIDSDYRGRVMVGLHNMNTKPITITHKERIAQLVIKQVLEIEFIEVVSLGDTERGNGGFGDSGTH